MIVSNALASVGFCTRLPLRPIHASLSRFLNTSVDSGPCLLLTDKLLLNSDARDLVLC